MPLTPVTDIASASTPMVPKSSPSVKLNEPKVTLSTVMESPPNKAVSEHVDGSPHVVVTAAVAGVAAAKHAPANAANSVLIFMITPIHPCLELVWKRERRQWEKQKISTRNKNRCGVYHEPVI